MWGYTMRKDEVLQRLRKIEGQVRGIAGMVEDDAYCIDILTQINAVAGALRGVSLGLLDDHVHHCVVKSRGDDRRQKADELVSTMARLLRR